MLPPQHFPGEGVLSGIPSEIWTWDHPRKMYGCYPVSRYVSVHKHGTLEVRALI